MPKLVKPKTIPSYMDRLSYSDEKRISEAAQGPVMLKAPKLISPPEGQISAPGQDLTSLTNLTAREGARDLPPGYIEGLIKGNVTQISPVYHGSPYKFKKFSSEKIGTGEGAQAFGYGHYLTEEQRVAQHYANTLGDTEIRQWAVKDIPLYRNGTTIDYSPRTNDSIAHAKAILQENLYIEEGKIRTAFEKSKQDGLKEIQRVFDDTLEGFSTEPFYQTGGIDYLKSRRPETIKDVVYRVKENKHLYEATLHKGKKPGEYEYLRWDEPLPENQKEKIIDLLRKSNEGGVYRTGLLQDLTGYENRRKDLKTGANWYKELETIFGQKRASEMLKKVGIDGIKYPAGSLSGMKSDKFNYVVFDPEDIVIEKLVNK